MKFVIMLVRMFARQAIFVSIRKLFVKKGKTLTLEELQEVDTTNMTTEEKRRHVKRLKKKQFQSNNNSNNKTSPWIYFLLLIIGLLVLYIITQKVYK